MDCRFCSETVPSTQHEMAYHLYDLSNAENRWRLCRDCAEIRTSGTEFTGGSHGERGECIDCDEDAAYGVALLKKTPAGDVAFGDTVYHVLCEDHLENRAE